MRTVNTAIMAYLVIGVLAWQLVAGWSIADLSARFPAATRTVEHCRENAGENLVWGLFLSTVWPVGVPVAYFLTGFAQHGWMSPWSCAYLYGSPGRPAP